MAISSIFALMEEAIGETEFILLIFCAMNALFDNFESSADVEDMLRNFEGGTQGK